MISVYTLDIGVEYTFFSRPFFLLHILSSQEQGFFRSPSTFYFIISFHIIISLHFIIDNDMK
jgi:hypothetical protein